MVDALSALVNVVRSSLDGAVPTDGAVRAVPRVPRVPRVPHAPRARGRRLALLLGCAGWLLSACGTDRVRQPDSAGTAPARTAPGGAAAAPVRGTEDTVPAAPFHWTLAAAGDFLTRGDFGPVQRLPDVDLAPRAWTGATGLSAELAQAPHARFAVGGTPVTILELGDAIAAGRAAAAATRAPGSRVAFTSNNLLLVAERETPAVARLRERITAYAPRSGLR